MSRSGYTDDCEDNWSLICWRGAVASSIRGKRGQAFLKELLAALDAMSDKRLIREHLQIDGWQPKWDDCQQLIVGADELVAQDGTVSAMGDVCALGALGRVRGLDMDDLDPEDIEYVANAFGIPRALACEIVYMNDEMLDREWVHEKREYRAVTPEERWHRMRTWVANLIRTPNLDTTGGA